MFRTQETLEQGKARIDDVVDSLNDIGVRPLPFRPLTSSDLVGLHCMPVEYL